jgi:hypothetical protein
MAATSWNNSTDAGILCCYAEGIARQEGLIFGKDEEQGIKWDKSLDRTLVASKGQKQGWWLADRKLGMHYCKAATPNPW